MGGCAEWQTRYGLVDVGVGVGLNGWESRVRYSHTFFTTKRQKNDAVLLRGNAGRSSGKQIRTPRFAPYGCV